MKSFQNATTKAMALAVLCCQSSAFLVPNPISSSTSTQAFAETTAESTTSSPQSASPMFEYLKFDGKPTFDVIAKTKEYIKQTEESPGVMNEDIYDEDYILRGPVIGPINRSDLLSSQNGLGVRDAYPNTKIETFGYTVDPENPYRCFYFQRWRAVMENDLDAFGDVYPATGTEAEMPVAVFSMVWTPEGKIIYQQVGATVDRFEGNTQGKSAIFGLLHHAGLKISASPGDKIFSFIQRLGHAIGGRGRSWSEKVPSWWVSKSRGADGTDQW